MSARVSACFVLVFILLSAVTAMATPSKIIWIPSTDVQPFMEGHLDLDNYLRAGSNSANQRDPNTVDVGFLLGILPFQKVRMEVGFDFLRDRLVTDPDDRVQRELAAVLVDEADSILVDEARIPMVLAGGVPGGEPGPRAPVRTASCSRAWSTSTSAT